MGRQGLPEVTFFLAVLSLSCLLISCGNNPGPGLSPPSGWKKSGFGVYDLKDPERQYRETVTILNDGHQPWRTEAGCAAASCLIDFGVVKDEDAFSLSDRLNVIDKNSLYSLVQVGRQYFVTVRFYDDVPVAVQLEIRVAPE